MIASAKELAVFFSNNQETFLRDLIPTRSEISNKLDVAIKNAGKNMRQRVRKGGKNITIGAIHYCTWTEEWFVRNRMMLLLY
jgi:hypothetical protein